MATSHIELGETFLLPSDLRSCDLQGRVPAGQAPGATRPVVPNFREVAFIFLQPVGGPDEADFHHLGA